MFRMIARGASLMALAAAFGAGVSVNALAQDYKDSGFLDDYSQLTVQTDSSGVARRMWVSPKFTRANYQKLLLEQISYYPQPQPSDKVPQGSLEDIRGYMTTALSNALRPVVPLATAPGPGVARVQIAITAAGVQGEALKPYDLIPIAFVVHTVSQAAGAGTAHAQLAVESKITDSVTGEVLARLVRGAKGIDLSSNQSLSLSLVKPTIDEWAASAADSIAARLKAGN